jgi:hypothetical protein
MEFGRDDGCAGPRGRNLLGIEIHSIQITKYNKAQLFPTEFVRSKRPLEAKLEDESVVKNKIEATEKFKRGEAAN